MKVSTSWLREYVDITLEPTALADALTMVGLEVDSLEDRYAYLASVRVGRVLSVSNHPDSDHLKCCQVDIGDQQLSIVCGAPNVVAGMVSACALPGTVMPDGRIIQSGKIRGQMSEGMLCSEGELVLGEDFSGIMSLSPDLKPGRALNAALNLSDTVLEIDLTPNRPDCLSVIGIAREVAAIQGNHLKTTEIRLPRASEHIDRYASVSIEDPDRCPRYVARLVLDVTVAPSPFWLQDRLVSVGLKPINNVVDVTNFVMMETGQPLHAFDFDRLAEHRIVVKTARPGETFVTLDQKERRLDEETLMICDGRQSVAVGGVMGGLNSEIEAHSTAVLIESACFNPVSIRKTAKKLGLATDASHRFERGVDPAGCAAAANRAAQLICETGDGRLIDGIIDENPVPYTPSTIALEVRRCNQRLGTDLGAEQIASYLGSIGFEVNDAGPEQLTVVPPSYRVDISRFEDLTEEVARLFGYNHIQTTFPAITAENKQPDGRLPLRNRIRQAMVGFGFLESINYSFISAATPERLNLSDTDPRRRQVPIVNPISEDQAVMRTTLIPGLLDTIRRNVFMQNRTVRTFEIGNVFFASEETDALPMQTEMLTAVWTGNRYPVSWNRKAVSCDFYDIKGAAEALLATLNIRHTRFSQMPANECRLTVPGATAVVTAGDSVLGMAGEISSAVLNHYEIKQPVYLFEFDMEQLSSLADDTIVSQPVPKFPSVSRDITLILSEKVESQRIVEAIQSLGHALVETAYLFDVYTGDPIAEGKKSISVRIVYRSADGTLEDDSVNRVHQGITAELLASFEADLPA